MVMVSPFVSRRWIATTWKGKAGSSAGPEKVFSRVSGAELHKRSAEASNLAGSAFSARTRAEVVFLGAAKGKHRH